MGNKEEHISYKSDENKGEKGHFLYIMYVRIRHFNEK